MLQDLYETLIPSFYIPCECSFGHFATNYDIVSCDLYSLKHLIYPLNSSEMHNFTAQKVLEMPKSLREILPDFYFLL